MKINEDTQTVEQGAMPQGERGCSETANEQQQYKATLDFIAGGNWQFPDRIMRMLRHTNPLLNRDPEILTEFGKEIFRRAEKNQENSYYKDYFGIALELFLTARYEGPEKQTCLQKPLGMTVCDPDKGPHYENHPFWYNSGPEKYWRPETEEDVIRAGLDLVGPVPARAGLLLRGRLDDPRVRKVLPELIDGLEQAGGPEIAYEMAIDSLATDNPQYNALERITRKLVARRKPRDVFRRKGDVGAMINWYVTHKRTAYPPDKLCVAETISEMTGDESILHAVKTDHTPEELSVPRWC